MFASGSGWSTIRFQVAWRVVAVVAVVGLVLAAMTVWLQSQALAVLVRGNLQSLGQFYGERIRGWEREWQGHAVAFGIHLQTTHAGGRASSLEARLRDLLVAQEEWSPFRVVLLTDADGRIGFVHNPVQASLPPRWPHVEESLQWFFDPGGQQLYRAYVLPVRGGDGALKWLVLLRPVDHGVLYLSGFPGTELDLQWEGRVVASSRGPARVGLKLSPEATFWEQGVRFDQWHLPWEVTAGLPSPQLTVRLATRPLFSTMEIGAVAGGGFLLIVLMLGVSLGRWLFSTTRRLDRLGAVARAFTPDYQLSPISQRHLALVRAGARDEICAVADSLEQLIRTVIRYHQIQAAFVETIRGNEERFSSLANSLSDAVVVFRGDGRIEFWNQSGGAVFGLDEEVVRSRGVDGLFPDGDPVLPWQERLKLAEAGGAAWQLETDCRREDGQVFPAEVAVSTWSRGGDPFLTVSIRDISDRRLMERVAYHSFVNRIALSAMLEVALAPIPLLHKLKTAMNIILTVPWLAVQRKGAIFLATAAGDLEMVVAHALPEPLQRACRRVAFGQCLCGRTASTRQMVYVPGLDHRHETGYAGMAEHGHYCTPIVAHERLLGVLCLYLDPGHPFSQEEEVFLASVGGTLAELIERGQFEEQIQHMAGHDTLTGLPNRRLFQELLQKDLVRATRGQRMLAVVFLDLDHFKKVNDTLGPGVGDQLLQEVGGRIRTCLRQSDTVARFGGDEFTVILSDVQRGSEQVVAKVVESIIGRLRERFVVQGSEVHIGASAGISIFPNDGGDLEGLIKSAGLALGQAKESGRETFRFFTPAMNERNLRRVVLERDLRLAVERGELSMHYQPKVDLATGQCVAMEALMRWHHPEQGMIPPMTFIPVAEESGLILTLGSMAIQMAVREIRGWLERGVGRFQVAVNLSARQFRQPDLPREVSAILASEGVDPELLELEVTESMIMEDPAEATRILEEIHQLGVRLAVDDFGTGYSSLSYLKRFPIDILKIDRSFIQHLTEDADDLAIVTAVISLARAMRLRVVAEGVESAEQVACLRALGCDQVQGYFFSPPMPASLMTDYLVQNRASCAP